MREQKDRVEVIQSTLFDVALWFPLIWFVLLSIFAIQEQSLSIYLDMGWIILIVLPLQFLEASIRQTKINHSTKTIYYKDGVGNLKTVNAGSVKEIVYEHGFYTIEFDENGAIQELRAPFIYYWPNKKRKILRALIKFSPDANIKGWNPPENIP